MRINTNISAFIANKNLQATQGKLSSSLEKLSSGYRINHAADDSAGMAIASKLRTQIRGLDQASRNAADGISVVQTAEGALNEVAAILQRMRELSVQGATGSLVDEDREAINDEIQSLAEEIDRISKDTEFNKKTLLDGSLDRRSYTNQNNIRVSFASSGVPADKYMINVIEKGEQAVVSGKDMTLKDGDEVTAELEGTIVINEYSIDINEGDTATEVYAKITNACDKLNITVEGFAENKLTFKTYEAGTTEILNIEISNGELADALGLERSCEVTGKDAVVSFDSDVSTADTVDREGFSESATLYTEGNTVTITDVGGFQLVFEIDPAYTDMGTPVTADVTDIGTMLVHIGANENQVIDICIPEISTESLGIDYINCLTAGGSGKAISLLDVAIEKVSSLRSQLGAYQNRLDAASSSIDVTSYNMEASVSRIEDVDMAEEMATYTQLNVLSQAGVSMVAQANELPQMVLQLIQ